MLQYDIILSDISGVLHNGSNLLPNVLPVFTALHAAGKNIVLVTNAPRPKEVVQHTLNKFGLSFLTNIITSGDLFLSALQNTWEGKKFYIVGKEIDHPLKQAVGINIVSTIEEAECLLFLDTALDNNEIIANYASIFKAAIARNITAICPNPDLIVRHSDKLLYVNGSFAKYYQELGGKVIYYGKPYPDIFDYALSTVPAGKAIMIGDTMYTDIEGANTVGVDSLLVLTGVTVNASEVAQYSFQPTYILPTL